MSLIQTYAPRFTIFIPLLAVIIWSFNVVLNRYSIDYISPLSISFYRWLIPLLILTPWMLKPILQHQQKIKVHLPQIAVLSALGMFICQGLGYIASHHTTAINMGMINAFVPFITLILAYYILKENLNVMTILGGCISIFGLLLIISKGHITSIINLNISAYGDGLMLTAVVSYSFYCILLKKWNLELNLLLILYLQILFAVLYHVPLIPIYGLDLINADNILIVLYAGVCTSLISSLLWMISVTQLGAHQTSIFMNLMPIFTACIATLWLNEQWSNYHSIGALMIFSGLYIGRQIKNNNHRLEPK